MAQHIRINAKFFTIAEMQQKPEFNTGIRNYKSDFVFTVSGNKFIKLNFCKTELIAVGNFAEKVAFKKVICIFLVTPIFQTAEEHRMEILCQKLELRHSVR